MHDDAADAGGAGRLRHAHDAVAEQGAAEPPALLRSVECQAASTATESDPACAAETAEAAKGMAPESGA